MSAIIKLSKLNVTEFKVRLSKNTLIGNPNVNGTPFVVFSLFYLSHHKFFGRVKNNSFEITSHTVFRPVPYKIAGSVIPNPDLTTNVEYTIKKIWFGYLWMRIIPAIIILIVIYGSIVNPELRFPLGLFGILFTAIGMGNIYRIERRLKRFETDFRITFEII